MPDKPRESVIGMSQAKLEHFEKAIKAKLDGFSSSDFDLCHDPRCLDIGKHYAKPETDYMLVSWDSALEAAERAITDLLERIGIVVLRSTTPWVAESSRSNSDLLTVISIVAVPTADAIASTGINPKPSRAGAEDTRTL